MSASRGPKNRQPASAHAQVEGIFKGFYAGDRKYHRLSRHVHRLQEVQARMAACAALAYCPHPPVPAVSRRRTKGPMMKSWKKTALLGSHAGALLLGGGASAAGIERGCGPNAVP